MSDEPFLGPAEQALFSIEATRERADRLRQSITPKLKEILDAAKIEIRGIYGLDSLADYSLSLTPAHRRDAQKTNPFEIASAGLILKSHPWYFQLRVECSREGISTLLFGCRGRESAPIVSVLQQHAEQAARLLVSRYCVFRANQFQDDSYETKKAITDAIGRLTTFPATNWDGGLYIETWGADLPVIDQEATWPVIHDLVALFPLFRAAADLRLGRKESFLKLMEKYWAWDADESENPLLIIDSDPFLEGWDERPAIEGKLIESICRHKSREKRLREDKIKQAMVIHNGRLPCEVPGCGFDYLETYGEIGRAFAHVHHKNPLSDRAEPEETRLEDLAVVCANCHAMVHRGNQCRLLDDLIPKRP